MAYTSIGEREIRIATIHPGLFSAEIVCSLEVVSLDHQPVYQALSYVWGDRDVPSKIQLNGVSIDVTHNLESAIRHLRHEHNHRRIWIDAICIDQSKGDEVNKQIELFGEIYEQTDELVIYVGDAKNDSDSAMQMIESMNSDLDSLGGELRWQGLDITCTPTFQDLLTIGATNEDGFQKPLKAIQDLHRREWWMRMWTIQEVFKPRKTMTFMCGREVVSWWAFNRVSLALTRVDWGAFRTPPVKFEHPIHAMRKIWQTGKRDSTLLTNLVAFNRRECGNLRDKVYALIGISSDIRPGDIKIDYKLDEYNPFIDAAEHIIRRNWGLKLLSMCQSSGRNPRLPSWVPDWSIDRKVTPQNQLRPNFSLTNWTGSTVCSYSAASNIFSSSFIFEAPRISPDRRLLTVKGLGFSEIDEVGVEISMNPAIALKQPVWKLLELITAKVPEPYPTGESKPEAFCRTLIGDRTAGFKPVTTELFQMFLNEHEQARIREGLNDPSKRYLLGATSMLPFVGRVYQVMHRRRFFVTKNGYMGIGPMDIAKGDRICLILGVEVPLVVRQVNNQFEVIGECYCHGIMNGEGLQGYWNSEAAMEDLILC